MLGPCEFCGRETTLTRHHLIPQTRHKNKWNKKNFSRAEVKERLIMLCPACHRQLHALFTEKELERGFSNPEALRQHPEMSKFIEWIRTKPPGFKPVASRSRTRRT